MVADPLGARKYHRFCQRSVLVAVLEARCRFAGHSSQSGLSEHGESIEAGLLEGSLCCCSRERGFDGIHN